MDRRRIDERPVPKDESGAVASAPETTIPKVYEDPPSVSTRSGTLVMEGVAATMPAIRRWSPLGEVTQVRAQEEMLPAVDDDVSAGPSIVVADQATGSSAALILPPSTTKAPSLFREEAVSAYLTAMKRSEVLRVAPPWTRGVLSVATLVVLGSLSAAFFVKVEQTTRGRGVLRVAGGVQVVASQMTGAVLEVGAHSGDDVASGALLAKIDSAATKAALLEAERQIARAQADVDLFASHRDKEQADRMALLRQRIAILQQRATNQRAMAGRLHSKVGTYERLVDAGLATPLDKLGVDNEASQSEQSALAIDEQISDLRLQLASMSAELTKELEQKQQLVQKAKDQRETLAFQLAQTEVRSPRGGRVESLVVKVGDGVAVGTPIARLIPAGAPRQIIVFVPEADRAFLQEGSTVAIELDQLPAGEFGSLSAKVVRIAGDLATQSEIAEALGDTKMPGPTYRIELHLDDNDAVQRLDKLLRPGSLVTARFVLRKRRLITLLFEPLRRLLE